MKEPGVSLRRELLNVPRGFLMGVADIIPGVSGGTVALILGIYERLVTAISRFDGEFAHDVRRGNWRAAAQHIDLAFLVTLGCGIALGILSLANVMHYLLEHQLRYTYAVFFGLILGSSLLVARLIRLWTPLTILALLGGIWFAWWVVGLPGLKNPPDGNLYIFFCGVIAICAMILPGISGSFILLILGKYKYVTGIIKDATRGIVSGEGLLTLAVFAAGCVLGLLGFSKLLRWLLSRHYSLTMGALCGFMLGSLRKIWPFKGGEEEIAGLRNVWPDVADRGAWIALGLMVAAFVLIFVLERVAAQRRPKGR